MKEYLLTIWNNHNHTIITAVLVTVGCVFVNGLEILLIVGGFWFGREHSQAEYRYMKLKGINRSKLGFFDGFKLEAWDKDSLINDLIIPIGVGLLIILVGLYVF